MYGSGVGDIWIQDGGSGERADVWIWDWGECVDPGVQWMYGSGVGGWSVLIQAGAGGCMDPERDERIELSDAQIPGG